MKKSTKKNAVFYVVILLVLIALGLFLKYKKTIIPVVPENPKEQIPTEIAPDPITIKTTKIQEENFSGTKPVISGESKLALTAQAYVDTSVDEFRKQANMDVPDMRAKFGADAPMANYTLDIEAKEVKGTETSSIVISEYAYTGGANGNNTYKVITAATDTGEILSLADIIKKDKQTAFTALIKKELLASKSLGVFPEEVKNLTFGSFSNWSLSSKNVTIYFSKYEIAPGAVGPVAFSLPLTKIKDFLSSTY